MKKCAALVLATTISLSATAEGIVDIQFLPASNGVNGAWGLGAYSLKDEGIGFYGNFVTSMGSTRKPMYESLSVTSFGDPVTQRYKDPFALNIGVTKKLGTQATMYAGIGYASVKGEAQKYDPLHILDASGTYYVKDPAEDKAGLNGNVGLLFTLGQFAFNIGYNSFLSTATFGVGMKF